MSTETVAVEEGSVEDLAMQLKLDTIAIRFRKAKFGVKRCYTPDEKVKVAKTFEADEDYVYGGKKIMDTNDPVYRRVTGILARASKYHHAMTLPYYGEKGIGLLRQTQFESYQSMMDGFKKELKDQALPALAAKYEELRNAMKAKLKHLWHESLYPADIVGEFGFRWHVVNIDPPKSLLELSPKAYAEAQKQAQRRMEESVNKAEQMFLTQLAGLVEDFAEKLRPGAGGKKKRFTEKSANEIVAFFNRFKQLNVKSNAQLDALVAQAEAIVGGIDPRTLKDQESAKLAIAKKMDNIAEAANKMVENVPKRKFIVEDE